MDAETFAKLMAGKDALTAAEKAHPNSRALKAVHGRAAEILNVLRGPLGLTDDQFTALGGGTNKE